MKKSSRGCFFSSPHLFIWYISASRRRYAMSQKLEIRARHIADLEFIAETETGHTVTLDTHEHNAGATPMEMLLASLAGCSGISVISILQKKQQNVTHYEVRAHG